MKPVKTLTSDWVKFETIFVFTILLALQRKHNVIMSDHITLWLGERLEVSKITSSLKTQTQTPSSMNESSQNI